MFPGRPDARSGTAAEVWSMGGRRLIWKVFAVLLAGMALPGEARADSCRQWGLTRDPCNACLLRRYHDMLRVNPNDSFALGKLRRCRSVRSLVRTYERKLAAHPGNYSYLVVLGRLYRIAGRKADAERAYQRAAKAKPGRYEAPLALAGLYEAQKKWAEARKTYEGLLRRTGVRLPKRVRKRVLRALANVCIVLRDMDAARRAFKELVALDPKNMQLRAEFARLLAANLRYEEALAEYRALVRRARGNARRQAELLGELGRLYEKMGRDADAVQTYRRAMRLTARGHWLRRELTDRIVAIYRRRNDLPSLIAYYEKHWRRRGFFEWTVLARLYEENGQIAKAIGAYRAALRVRPRALDTRDRLIVLLKRSGRRKEALRELERQSRLAPDEPRYLIRLAKAYWRARKPGRAIALLGKCGRRFPTDPSVHVVLADLYARWGRPNLAFKEYKRLVRIDPGEPSHWVDLGEEYWQRGRKAEALASWRKLLAPGMYPTKQEAYASFAQVLLDHRLVKEAISYYERAIALDRQNPALYRAVALAYAQVRRYSDAVRAWQQVIRLAKGEPMRPWRRQARRSIVSIWKLQGVLRARLRTYRRRFARTKSLEDGFFLAEALLELRKLGEAARVLQSLISAHPEEMEARLVLVDVYVRQRRYAKAVGLLEDLARRIPARARDFYMRIAELYLLAYEDAKALVYAKKALELSKGDADGWARVGRIYERQGDEKRAIEAYRKALSIRKRFFSVAFALARLHVRRGEYAEAARLYHSIVAESPDEETVRRAGSRALDLDEYLQDFLELERRLVPLAFVYTHKKVYRDLLLELYARWVPILLREKSYASSEAERRRAEELLRQLGRRALKPLLEALGSGNPEQRDRAIALLGHLGNPEAAPALVRLALDPPEGLAGAARLAFQVRALTAAGRLGDAQSVRLFAKLARSREVAIREVAVWALGLVGGSASRPVVLEALRDRKVTVEVLACLAASRFGEQAVGRLVEVLEDGRRRVEVRRACALALGWTGSGRGAALLRKHAKGAPLEIRVAATVGLGYSGRCKDVAARLAEQAWTAPRDLAAAQAWAAVRCSAGRPLPVPWDRIREVRLRADGRLPVLSLLRELLQALPPPSEAERREFLGKHGQVLARGMAQALKRYRDVKLRALQWLDSSSARPGLGPFGGEGQSRAVAAVLSRLRPLLWEAARSRDPEVRARAVSVLLKSGEPGGWRLAKRSLEDPDEQVRWAAIRALVAWARQRGRQARVARLLEARFLEGRVEDRCEVLSARIRLGGRGLRAFLSRLVRPEAGVAVCLSDALASLPEGAWERLAELLLSTGRDVLVLLALREANERKWCPGKWPGVHVGSRELDAELAELRARCGGQLRGRARGGDRSRRSRPK